MLELKDVMISYKNVSTVEHFSMRMKQGQIVSDRRASCRERVYL